jgi:flagellar hook-associated protein 2
MGEGKLTIAVGDKTIHHYRQQQQFFAGLCQRHQRCGCGCVPPIDTGNGFQLVLSADETGTANAGEMASH